VPPEIGKEGAEHQGESPDEVHCRAVVEHRTTPWPANTTPTSTYVPAATPAPGPNPNTSISTTDATRRPSPIQNP
jgi:hypothetical protein